MNRFRRFPITDYKSYERLSSFISNNQDSVLALISYSSALIAEIIKNFPKFKLILYKILFRLKLISKPTGEFRLSETQEYYYDFCRRLYGYIVDIRIAACVFNFIPYITNFFKNYNTPSKLAKNLNTVPKSIDFLKYLLLFNYQIYELFGFLTSHNFLDREFISRFTLFKKHREDENYDKSDYLYVYSCKFWFYYNIVEILESKFNNKKISLNLIADTILSYHWSLKNGLLNREQFAVIGFLNTFDKFKKLLK